MNTGNGQKLQRPRPAWLDDLVSASAPDFGPGGAAIWLGALKGESQAIAQAIRWAATWTDLLRLIERDHHAILKKEAATRREWPVMAELPAAEMWAKKIKIKIKALGLGAERSDRNCKPRENPTWALEIADEVVVFVLDEAVRLGVEPTSNNAFNAGWSVWCNRNEREGDPFNDPRVIRGLLDKRPKGAWAMADCKWIKDNPAPQKKPGSGSWSLKWKMRREEAQLARRRAWLGKQKSAMKREVKKALYTWVLTTSTPEKSPL